MLIFSRASDLTDQKSQKQRYIIPIRMFSGLFLSGGISLLAYRRRSLNRSGTLGAVITGTSTFGLGGLSWGLSLIFFFLSSSFFSHFRAQEKAKTAADKFSKGSQRDFGQVMANGGTATILALSTVLSPHNDNWQNTLASDYVGALATANADTWATELGVLSKSQPRLITTGKKTQPGTSGGITPLGTTAAAAGALSLGLFFTCFQRWSRTHNTTPFPLIALISGLAGSFFDSFLGATTQAIYFCPNCQQETEQRIHSCGKPTQLVRGLLWMNNDMVNFLATGIGALSGMILHWLFSFRQKHARQKRYPNKLY